jgi:solute carrier family 45, member 1/2/4
MWAPATFLGVEVNKLSGSVGSGHASENTASYHRLSNDSAIEMSENPSPPSSSPPSNTQRDRDTLRLEHGPDAGPPPPPSTGELSGVYFGISNIYTTIPQFISTFISTIVFAVLEPGKSPELATDAHPSEHHGTDGPNAIAVCLFIGAISMIGAAYATSKLKYL